MDKQVMDLGVFEQMDGFGFGEDLVEAKKTYGSWGVLDGLGDLVRQITDSRLCSATSGSSSHALCFQHIKSWQETHQGAPSAAKSSDPTE